jgi:hypothetical protein
MNPRDETLLNPCTVLERLAFMPEGVKTPLLFVPVP